MKKQTKNKRFLVAGGLGFVLVLLASVFLIQKSIITITGDEFSNIEADQGSVLPTFTEFVESVKTDDPDLMVGIYSAGILADRIVHQPQGNSGAVIAEPEKVTLFALAKERETLGLLAHNYLAGDDFFNIKLGTRIYLILGDGTDLPFEVSEIHDFQALEPLNPQSDFVNLVTHEKLASGDVFSEMYDRYHHMVLQTCIERDGDPSWGRRFIIATPVSEEIDIDIERVKRLK